MTPVWLDKKKALEHYNELRRAGRVKRAQVLGRMLTPNQIGELLMIAADALAAADEQRTQPRPEAHQRAEVGEVVGLTKPDREITLNAEGIMVPPSGQTIISCGVCQHPRFYVTMRLDDEQPGLFSCAHCGNEIKLLRVHHDTGHA